MIAEILRTQKDKLVANWQLEVRGTYPKAGRIKFAQQSEMFNDPIGHILKRDLPVLFDLLLEDEFEDKQIQELLDPLCRLRSVQTFSPSQAIGFVYSLKKVVREILTKDQLSDATVLAELLAFESRIDKLAMYAFDIYVACREDLFELKSREASRRSDLIIKHFGEQGKHAFDETADPSGDLAKAVKNGHEGGGA
jgi:RsbT co-antagonist protein rsbRD N-terminal domain